MLNDDVQSLQSGKDGTNILTAADPEKGVYSFSDIDSSISELRAGDKMAVHVGDSEFYMMLVSSVNISGSSATVNTRTEYSPGDVYQFIKIDYETPLEDLGNTPAPRSAENAIAPLSAFALEDTNAPIIDVDKEFDKSFKREIEEKSGSVTAKASFTANISAKIIMRYDPFRFTKDYFYLKAAAGAKVHVDASITGKGEEKIEPSFPRIPIPVGTHLLTVIRHLFPH